MADEEKKLNEAEALEDNKLDEVTGGTAAPTDGVLVFKDEPANGLNGFLDFLKKIGQGLKNLVTPK